MGFPPQGTQAEVIARPKGGVLVSRSIDINTTWIEFQTVVEHIVPNDFKFELAKILVSCPNDVMYRLLWGTTTISAAVYVTGGIPFTDWFPWDYYTMRGDGTSTFKIQVQDPTLAAAGLCHAEIVGEDVP